jgi:hypothetical protein
MRVPPRRASSSSSGLTWAKGTVRTQQSLEDGLFLGLMILSIGC